MKSKTIAIVVFILIITTAKNYSNTPVIMGTDTVLVNKIGFIKQKFADINANLKNYKKMDIDIMDESTEGGEMAKYLDGKHVKKITQLVYGEMGRSSEEFYYDDDRLIFYYKKHETYDMPMYVKGSKIRSKIETRAYLFDDKIIKYLYTPIQASRTTGGAKEEVEILKRSARALKRKS